MDARLWQDPFEAVKNDRQRSKAGNHDPKDRAHLLEDLQEQLSSISIDSQKPLYIIPVILPGGPYPENAEMRLRVRDAILSGVSVAQYIPEDTEHIGYIDIPWIREISDLKSAKEIENEQYFQDLTKNPSPPSLKRDVTHISIPYEWCKPIDEDIPANNPPKLAMPSRPPGRILLLWISDSDFSDNLPLRIRDLLSRLTAKMPPHAYVVKLIGPASSDSLRALVDDETATGYPNRSRYPDPLALGDGA